MSARTSIDVMAALLDQGVRFFRLAQNFVQDPEAMDAFRTAADVRALLLNDLRATGLVSNDAAAMQLPEALGYDNLRQRFDPAQPALIAPELLQRETAMQSLIDRVFRESENFKVRRLMQNCVKLFRRDAQIWTRLARRNSRAA